MILRFQMENHRSFKESCELSFVSTSRGDEPLWRHETKHSKHGVLPAIGVWGANAAGKSNLLKGLQHLRQAVAFSFVANLPAQQAPWLPFQLGSTDSSLMEIELLLDGDRRCQFGFRQDNLGFAEEWLYVWNAHRPAMLYYRDRKKGWNFGQSFRGQKKQISDATRDNSLFLSTGAQHNNPLLSEIHSAITSGIQAPGAVFQAAGYPLFRSEDPLLSADNRKALLSLLAAADLGIVGVHVEAEPLPDLRDVEKIFQPDVLEAMRSEVPSMVHLRLLHGAPGEKPWSLPPFFESRGTNALLPKIGDALGALKNGNLLVFDEIDSSLHPDLCAELIRMFTSRQTNQSGAQLLFTSHNTRLVDELRTDQVVFVDKDLRGRSSLTTASDYKGLRPSQLRRALESGRVGGVPILGNFGASIELALDGS